MTNHDLPLRDIVSMQLDQYHLFLRLANLDADTIIITKHFPTYLPITPYQSKTFIICICMAIGKLAKAQTSSPAHPVPRHE